MFRILEILAVFLLVGYVTYYIYNKGYDNADMRWKVKWEQVQIDQQKALQKAKDDVRNEEQEKQKTKDKAIEGYVKTISDLQRSNTQSITERSRLRDSITSLTDDNSKAVSNLGTCRTTAAGLGLLLRTSEDRADRDAGELESLNASVTLLLNSWPQ